MGARMVAHLGDLTAGLERIARRARPQMAKVVAKNARAGNRLAKGFASEQHTMNSDIDEPYARSFSAERKSQLEWEYGPEFDTTPHGGSQASGYEGGSINQKPHLNLARSQDIAGPKFAHDVGDEAGSWFW